jgi:hypothetical protein
MSLVGIPFPTLYLMKYIEKKFCSKYRKVFWKDGEMGMDLSSLFALPDGLEVAETDIVSLSKGGKKGR